MKRETRFLAAGAVSLLITAGYFASAPWSASSRLAALLVYLPPLFYLLVSLTPLFLTPSRRHPATVLSLACTLIVLAAIFQFRCHRGGGTSEGCTILTLNVHNARNGVAGLADFVDRSQADIVFLQEMRETQADRDAGRTAQKDPLPLFLARSTVRWHWARGTVEKDNDGLVILSRIPLSDVRTVWLTHSAPLLADSELLGKPVTLVNVHLNRGPGPFYDYLINTAKFGQLQAGKLREHLDRDLTVLAGDLNGPPNAPNVLTFTERLEDTHLQAGAGFPQTFPARLPLWRLDYILVSPSLKVLESRVLKWGESDHRPVRCRVTLR